MPDCNHAYPAFTSQLSGNQQLVHAADELVWIFERAALSKQRLIQQKYNPHVEKPYIQANCRALPQHVVRKQIKDL